MLLEGVNYWAVLTAAVANMILGGFWYSDVMFIKSWERITKVNMKKTPKMAFLWAFISAFVTAYILANVFQYVGVDGVIEGITTAFWMWLGFVATVTAGMNLWERRPIKLYLINNGYNLLSMIVIGIILAVW